MLKPDECIGCPLYELGNGFSEPEGNGTLNVAIVGEALGREEAIHGLPFRPKAQAGSKLEEVFRLCGYSRNQFFLWNVIGCQPPNDLLAGATYEVNAVSHCDIHFSKHLGNFSTSRRNTAILALGNTALTKLTGVSGDAEERQSVAHLRGYVLPSSYGPVIPSYHPSFLKRGKPAFTSYLIQDLKKAVAVAQGECTNFPSHSSWKEPEYNEFASVGDAESFYAHVRDNEKMFVSYDIETPITSSLEEDERGKRESHKIDQIQFSCRKGMGIAFKWEGRFIEVAKKILALPNHSGNHNCWNFDNPRLVSNGVVIGSEVNHDTMWMFKHWHPGLERALQKAASLFGFPFPWKHQFSKRLGFYGCADVDAVQYLYAGLPDQMRAMGVWQGYERDVRGLYSVILSRAAEVGVPVNEEKRLALYNDHGGEKEATGTLAEQRKDINERLQRAIPDEIRNIKPKRKQQENGYYDYGYLREPKEVSQCLARYQALCASARRRDTNVSLISFDSFLQKETGLVKRTFQFRLVPEDYVETQEQQELFEIVEVERYCRVEEFTPSLDQLSRYIRWKHDTLLKSDTKADKQLAKLYVVPVMPKKNKDGVKEDRETTGRKVLEQLEYETGDEVLKLVGRYRSVDTAINNYVPNWKPSRDGRVHTQWGFKAPTGQLDSSQPNILNLSKHSETGQLFSQIVEVPRGYILVEADYKSYHVCTMAYCADSKNYLRFASLDPHSIFTSYIMPKEWGKPIEFSMSDGEILERCKWIKNRCKEESKKFGDRGRDLRQDVSKPAVLGNQLGLGARKLYLMNRRSIDGIREAERLQKILAELFPEVEEAKKCIKEEAHQRTFLRNEFGFIQWFYDIYSWMKDYKGQWQKRNGTDAEKALAFKVQGTAFGHLKWHLYKMEELGLNEKWNFLMSIHDSVVYMPREEELEECVDTIYNMFSLPCPVLINRCTGKGGLKVGVEISVGKNRAEMKGVR